MEQSKLRKILKNNIECYPFNDKYSNENLLANVSKTLTKEELSNDKLNKALLAAPFMNYHYKEYYSVLKDKIYGANIKYDVLIDLLFTVFNRNFLVLSERIIDESKKASEFIQKNFYSHKIQTINKSMQKVEASAALEADVEGMNFVMNYIKYFSRVDIYIDPKIPNTYPIDIAKEITFLGSYYSVLKEVYDDSIWNDGNWEHIIDEEGALKMDVVFSDSELLILNKIGLLRMQRNSSSNLIGIIKEIQNETPYGIYLIELIKSKKKKKRIKEVWYEKGFVKFKLAKGFGKKDTLNEIKNMTSFITYYSFLKDMKLPNLENLELLDLIALFSLLQDIFNEVMEKNFDNGIDIIDDIYKFPIKILTSDIEDYLFQRIELSKKQIKAFVNLISCGFEERINLWDTPLVKYKGWLYVNYLPSLAPILSNLIDYWIDKGGYSLDERGALLEKYLKDEIGKILSKKQFQNLIPTTSFYVNGKGEKEEIDLVVNLKTAVLVCEVKCIKYPLEPRDKHNALLRLEKGVQQVKRKAEFLDKNRIQLESVIGNYETKEIVPIVITNYPIYSEYQIDNIPITDFYLVESFFKSGKLVDGKIFKDGTKEIINEHYYYKNEDEMNEAVKTFFKNSYPIQEFRDIYEITKFRITPDNLSYQINVTSAQIKEQFNKQ